jgi:hypothetical protein
VAASGLRLGGEQKHMRTGPHQTGSGHVSVSDPRLGPVQGPGMFYPGTPPVAARTPYGGSGFHPRGPACSSGGSGPTLEVRTVYPEVRDQPWGPDSISRGFGALLWGSGLIVDALEHAAFSGHVVASDPPIWQSQALLWTQSRRPRLGRGAAWSHTALLPRN